MVFEEMVIREFMSICNCEYVKGWDDFFDAYHDLIIDKFLWDKRIPASKYKLWMSRMINDKAPHSPSKVIPCINGENYTLEYIQAYITNMIDLYNKITSVQGDTTFFNGTLNEALLVSETDYISIEGVVYPERKKSMYIYGIVGGILLTYFFIKY